MANKKEKSEITYKGVKYALVFNLNVMENIQEEYGDIGKWIDLTENAEEPSAKAIKYGLTEMINEGIDIYNEEHADDEDFEPRPFFTVKQVGRIITELGLQATTKAIHKTVIDSTKTDEKN